VEQIDAAFETFADRYVAGLLVAADALFNTIFELHASPKRATKRLRVSETRSI